MRNLPHYLALSFTGLSTFAFVFAVLHNEHVLAIISTPLAIVSTLTLASLDWKKS